MNQGEENKDKLKKLVDELLKENPRSQLVKALTLELSMPYSGDPLTQMSTVLNSLNSIYLRPSRRKELER